MRATNESMWLTSLLEQMDVPITRPLFIYEDNQSAISFSQNQTDHRRSKHIDQRYHIELIYISTGQQLADIMTKPLPKDTFERLRSTFMSN